MTFESDCRRWFAVCSGMYLNLEEPQTRNSCGNDTWYDRNGRIVFATSRGLTGVGLARKVWEAQRDQERITQTIIADTLSGGPREREFVYEVPCEGSDRGEDYRGVWKAFSDRRASAKRGRRRPLEEATFQTAEP